MDAGTDYDHAVPNAQFKTMKYQPGFPARFGSLADARAHCALFFTWYNQQHRHSDIGMMTPESVHTGRGAEVRKQRQATVCRSRRSCRRLPGSTRRPWRKKLPETRDLDSHRFNQVFQIH
jgi:putative transposase